MLQKRAIRIVEEREPPTEYFLIESKTKQIMYKAKIHQLPESIQKMFIIIGCQHELVHSIYTWRGPMQKFNLME